MIVWLSANPATVAPPSALRHRLLLQRYECITCAHHLTFRASQQLPRFLVFLQRTAVATVAMINEGLHMRFKTYLRVYRYMHGNTIEIISLFGWVNFWIGIWIWACTLHAVGCSKAETGLIENSSPKHLLFLDKKKWNGNEKTCPSHASKNWNA